MVTMPFIKRGIAPPDALNTHPSAVQNTSGVHVRKDARWRTLRGLTALYPIFFHWIKRC